MISGGMPTVYVSDMTRSITLYTQSLELALAFRAGDHWASIDAGAGLVIGLHPRTDSAPAPGTPGAITVGLNVDLPIEDAVATLTTRGVEFLGGVVNDGMLKIVHFADPDGNPLYLCEQPSWGR